MNVSWNYYIKRRGIDVPATLKAQGITGYEKLTRFLASVGVDAPAEDVVAHYFVKEEPLPPAPEIKKPEPRKRPSKQSVRLGVQKAKSKSLKPAKAKTDE